MFCLVVVFQTQPEKNALVEYFQPLKKLFTITPYLSRDILSGVTIASAMCSGHPMAGFTIKAYRTWLISNITLNVQHTQHWRSGCQGGLQNKLNQVITANFASS